MSTVAKLAWPRGAVAVTQSIFETTEQLAHKQVFDNAIVGICLMANRRFLHVNRCMADMLGYSQDELLGRSVRMVYARTRDYRDVGRVLAAFPRDNQYIHEHPLITKDGKRLWCLISGRKVDRRDPDSPSVWVVQDITAKKRAEDELARANQQLEQTVRRRTLKLERANAALHLEVKKRRATEFAMIESREKYRVLIGSIPLGIVITDTVGVIIEANAQMQAWLGTSTLDRFVRMCGRITCTNARDGSGKSLREVICERALDESRRPDPATVSWRGIDETQLWFDMVGVRVPVRGLGAAIVFSDCTSQRRAREREIDQQQQLAHASRLSLMGQFASALAHELGQPLTASLSYVAGIERRLQPLLRDRPDERDALERVLHHLAQAGDIIRNVRTFLTRHRPESESVDLAALLHGTLELLHLPLHETAVTVIRELPRTPLVAHGNRVELQQVLVNLIVNAMESIARGEPAKRTITVRLARRRGERAAVSVTDSGPGIPAQFRAKIFDPYFTTKAEGLGMGLMICATIVESHGGKLRLDPRRRHGARFEFSLPLDNPRTIEGA